VKGSKVYDQIPQILGVIVWRERKTNKMQQLDVYY